MNDTNIIENLKNNKISINKLYHIKNLLLFYNKVIKFNEIYYGVKITTYSQMLYNYIYDIKTYKLCENEVCNNRRTFFKSFTQGYTNFCSNKCINSSKKIKEKIKQTSLNKYGVKSYMMTDDFKKKSTKTNLERYGVKHPLQNKFILQKTKQTIIEKYGVDWYSKSDDFKKKHYNNSVKLFSERLLISRENIKYSGIDGNFTILNYCSKHNQFEIPYSILRNRIVYGIKNICTKCNPISEQSSVKEIELKNFIKNDLNITNIIENDKNILNGKELDVYLPEHKIGVEFNGLYWHSELYKDKNYHLNKTNLVETKGIELIHIFEDEWIYKLDIVKSIIKSKLGLIENKIFARKTDVKEISPKESRDFLNTNHIQGNVNASIKLGLYYKDDLVSVMTFGKKRKIMGSDSIDNHYEMYRFCNKLNSSVIGGSSKLFKYFTKHYNPKQVISYADRRYFTGKIYKNLGFELKGETKPNYYYFKQNEFIRHYRFKFRKDVLKSEGFDSTKTEHEIMLGRKYLRIYDSGNLKYIYTNK